MALKTKLNEEERYGLTVEEIRIAEKYLKKYKTKGIIADMEAIKLYELYMIGTSFVELQKQFPQYQTGQIILTAALKRWCQDRDKMQQSLAERVRSKVVKSVVDQVDFLTTMMAVTNAEHLEEMRKYILDPANHPKPTLRVSSIKEYKDVVETLYKIVAGATPGSKSKTSPVFGTLTGGTDGGEIEDKTDESDEDETDLDDLMKEELDKRREIND